MGFHLRKSFKIGAMRFNLSNSGIGFSTGIKGLRIGVDGKGRSYIAGGKGIVRFRQTISNSKTETSKNAVIPEEKTEIKRDLPEELKTAGGWSFLIFLSFFINSLFLIALIVEPPPKEVFITIFVLMILIALPLLKFKRVKRGNTVKDAFYYYNKREYSAALEKFFTVQSMIKKEKWQVREFISDCIYKCYLKLNNFDEAVNFLKTDTDIFRKEEKLIDLYFFLEKYQEIIVFYNEKKEFFKNLSDTIENETYNKIYESYIKLNNYNDALVFLNEHSILNKRQKIVECYYKMGNWEELILYLQKSYGAAEREEHPVYYAMLADAFMKQGKPDIALETLLSGPINKRSMNAEMCAFRYTLGECYELTGDRANALKQYQKVYAFDVNYENIQEKINGVKN